MARLTLLRPGSLEIALRWTRDRQLCPGRGGLSGMAPVRKCRLQDWAEGKVGLRCNCCRSSAAPTNCWRAGTAFHWCPKCYSWTSCQTRVAPTNGGCDLGQNHSLQPSTMPRTGFSSEPFATANPGSWGKETGVSSPSGATGKLAEGPHRASLPTTICEENSV